MFIKNLSLFHSPHDFNVKWNWNAWNDENIEDLLWISLLMSNINSPQCKAFFPPAHDHTWTDALSLDASVCMPVYCLNHQHFKMNSKMVLTDFLFAAVQEKLHSDILCF